MTRWSCIKRMSLTRDDEYAEAEYQQCGSAARMRVEIFNSDHSLADNIIYNADLTDASLNRTEQLHNFFTAFKNSVEDDGMTLSVLEPKSQAVPRLLPMERKSELSLKQIEECYNLPMSEACKVLDISCTYLKKLCREHDIRRWPQRKVASIQHRLRDPL